VVNSQPKGEAKFSRVRIHVKYSLSKTLLCTDRFIDYVSLTQGSIHARCSADAVTVRLRLKGYRPY
jgi:hypothetical protein